MKTREEWIRTKQRMVDLVLGNETDRIPYVMNATEALGARISGLTIGEMLTSGKKLAKASIQTCDFLGNDIVSPVAPGGGYLAPFEAIAFAKANGKEHLVEYRDYDTPFIHEGKICETEEDIEKLEIPDHRKVEPWPTLLEAYKYIEDMSGPIAMFSPSLTWSNVQLLRGSRAYIDVVKNPDLILKLCDKIYESQMDFFKAFVDSVGKPFALFNCQYAFNKQMLSFEDAWKFEGQYVARFCKETQLPLMVHNCGFEPYWDEMVDKMREEGVFIVGVNGSHPLDLDYWVEFNKKYPELLIAGASIYVNNEIVSGTPEDVKNRVKENIVKLGHTNKLMIVPTCSAMWGSSMNNLMAVKEAVEEYGYYPLKV